MDWALVFKAVNLLALLGWTGLILLPRWPALLSAVLYLGVGLLCLIYATGLIGVVSGLIPNPGVGELGALSNHQMIGGATWGGTEEGLNASIAMTVVLVALIVPLLPSFARSAAPREASARA